MIMFVNTSINRRGIVRKLRPVWCKPRSKLFCTNLVFWDSLNLSLIGGSSNCHACYGRKGATNRRITFKETFGFSDGQQRGGLYQYQVQPSNQGQTPHILKIWAQASWSLIRRMAHTMNHRGAPMPASPQRQPAAAPATSLRGGSSNLAAGPARGGSGAGRHRVFRRKLHLEPQHSHIL